MLMQPFGPLTASGNLANALVVATGNVAASATLRPYGVGSAAGNQACVQICNMASVWLWLNFGTASLTAAAVPAPGTIPIVGVPPNAVVVYTIDPTVTTVSYILPSGTGIAVFNLGEGV